ncbi:eCIS core domain-containing protein [Kocuria turfanensis]|uniref:eCIS core domain-containing protein n=1 Tax=Kocuria turfanensis TaxID=388357 RepID=A0A512IAR2_9MICC|nr:DUF4157 domain-containing protein [Kocuria turfanensis]GEO94795.1 hypothetical protein KTU01_09180 [Kocuria turfanensis]
MSAPAGRRARLRAAWNMANLSTPLGLLVAALTGTRVVRGPEGLLLGFGYRPRLPRAGAFTVGNVVLFRAGPDDVAARPRLLAHESRHASQYALCLGLPFLPLYGAAAGWSVLRCGHPAPHNPFEVRAGLADGGYRVRPRRRRKRTRP